MSFRTDFKGHWWDEYSCYSDYLIKKNYDSKTENGCVDISLFNPKACAFGLDNVQFGYFCPSRQKW